MTVVITSIGSTCPAPASGVTTATITVPTGGIPAGSVLIGVTSEGSTAATTSGALTSTVTGSSVITQQKSGNRNGAAASGMGSFNALPLTVGLSSGNTITYTKASSSYTAGFSAFYVTGLSTSTLAVFDFSSQFTGASSVPSMTEVTSPFRAGEFYVGLIAYGSSAAYTQDTSTAWATPPNSTARTAGGAGTGAGVGGGNVIHPSTSLITFAPKIAAASATYIGWIAAFKVALSQTVATGNYNLTGEQTASLKGSKASIRTGTYVLSGEALTFTATVIAAPTSESDSSLFVIAYETWRAPINTAALYYQNLSDLQAAAAFSMSVQTGLYVLTGEQIKLLKGSLDKPQAGTYAVTGEQVKLIQTSKATLSAGTYALTGEQVKLLKASKATAQTTFYSLTVEQLTFKWGHFNSLMTGYYQAFNVQCWDQNKTNYLGTSGVGFSNQNLTITSNDGNNTSNVLAVHGAASGKLYFEFTLTNLNDSFVGLADPTYPINGFTSLGVPGSIAMIADGSDIFLEANSISNQYSGYTNTTATVFRIAIDIGNQLIWINAGTQGWNGFGSGNDPGSGIGGVSYTGEIGSPIFPAASLFNNGQGVTANFGPNFTYPVPSGFSAWPSNSVEKLLWDHLQNQQTGFYNLIGENLAFTFSGTTSFTMTLGAGMYSLTDESLTLLKASKVNVQVGNYALTGEQLALLAEHLQKLGAGTYALSGEQVKALWGHIEKIQSGTYALTGENLTLKVGHTVFPQAGFYTFTGENSLLLKKSIDSLQAGFYSLTPQSLSLSVPGQFFMTINTGIYALTGENEALTKASKTVIFAGNYALSGENEKLLKSSVLVPFTTIYTVSGEQEALLKKSSLKAQTVTFTLTLENEVLAKHVTMPIGAGSYTLTGEQISEIAARLAQLGAGSYVVSGELVTLTPGGGSFALKIIATPTLLGVKTQGNLTGQYGPAELLGSENDDPDLGGKVG